MNSLPILIALLAQPPQHPTFNVPQQYPTELDVSIKTDKKHEHKRKDNLPLLRKNVSTLPETYREAYDIAVSKGKPLIVWRGAGVTCPNCIQHNDNEFVHLICKGDAASLFPKDSITVGVPSNGKLLMAGQVTRWDDGHIPTIREILRKWRETRKTQVDVSPPGGAGEWLGQSSDGGSYQLVVTPFGLQRVFVPTVRMKSAEAMPVMNSLPKVRHPATPVIPSRSDRQEVRIGTPIITQPLMNTPMMHTQPFMMGGMHSMHIRPMMGGGMRPMMGGMNSMRPMMGGMRGRACAT